ncbi:helix-turn-helix domain-containing protein [Kitasatospora aureofaciens]|uniref:helix-turn-helix domain-containing protein n=1 Tax=Kitasatospora aureofaciens TaxID=1894 RepID=UPI0033F0B3D1
MPTLTPEPDSTSSPVARFGTELRRLRRARGWTQEKLGGLLGYSDTWISLIERGKETPTSKLALKADEVFETGGRFAELLRRITGAALLEGFEEFADLEGRCRKLRTFELGVIPGLLQVRSYAETLVTAAVMRGTITEDQADERLAFLAKRQHLLERMPKPVVHAVLDESCLMRLIGGRLVMIEQLAQLEELAIRPNITIQVSPFSLGEHRPFTCPVTLLTLSDRAMVAYSESQQRGYLERGREPVAAWDRDYDQLQVESLPKMASLARIREVREELEKYEG